MVTRQRCCFNKDSVRWWGTQRREQREPVVIWEADPTADEEEEDGWQRADFSGADTPTVASFKLNQHEAQSLQATYRRLAPVHSASGTAPAEMVAPS